MKTIEQIARDMREGTFPAKSEKTLREERMEVRPSGSNADEWHLFLSEHLDSRANFPNGLTYMAVQIAEAIDLAREGYVSVELLNTERQVTDDLRANNAKLRASLTVQTGNKS